MRWHASVLDQGDGLAVAVSDITGIQGREGEWAVRKYIFPLPVCPSFPRPSNGLQLASAALEIAVLSQPAAVGCDCLSFLEGEHW